MPYVPLVSCKKTPNNPIWSKLIQRGIHVTRELKSETWWRNPDDYRGGVAISYT